MQKHPGLASVLFMQLAHSPGGHFADSETQCPKSRPVSPCARQRSTQILLPSAFDERPPTKVTAAAPIPEKNNRRAWRRDIPLARSFESLSSCFFIEILSSERVNRLSRRS